MTARKITLPLLITLVVALSATNLYAQSNEPPTNGTQKASFIKGCDWLCQLLERQAQQLEGSWEMIVTPVPPPGAPPLPSRHLYVTFARGGIYIGFDRSAPFGSTQHGVWEHRGGNEFAWTFMGDNFDALGNFLGTLKLRAKITMTGKDTFVGVANPQVRDAAGNVVLDACSTFKAERIKAEPVGALPEHHAAAIAMIRLLILLSGLLFNKSRPLRRENHRGATMPSMLTLVFILTLAAQPARSQTKENDADRKSIEAIAASFRDAWNHHDMDGLASLVAEDVDYVTVVGARDWEKGRKEFKERHGEVHQTMFKDSVLTIKETHVKFLRPDIVLVHVLWETKGDVIPERKPGEPRAGIFTWVVEKRSGKWLIIASQNTENKTPVASR